jgi:hypothetical protein
MMSDKLIVGKGLELSQGSDGHWLTVKAGNYKASICLESLHGIAKEALLKWAEWAWSENTDQGGTE